MPAIELSLFAAMLDTGDLSPIFKGQITEDHCITHEGQALYHFLSNYREFTNGQGRVPSRDIIRNRFGPSIQLPETTGNEDLDALAYEVRLEKIRADLRTLSDDAESVAEIPDPFVKLTELRSKLDGMLEEVSVGDDLSYGSTIESIVEDYDNGALLPWGMQWPWPTMNDATRGIHREEFLVVAGRPKARKTFVAIAVGAHAFSNGHRVLCISPEMPPRQMMLRFTATRSQLRYAEFKAGKLTPEEEARFIDDARNYAARTLPTIAKGDPYDEYTLSMPTDRADVPFGTEPNFVVSKGTGQGVGFVRSKIKQYNPDIVLIDSFYRLQNDNGRKNDADWKAVTGISRSLKDLAMDENVAIIGTHQLNRKTEDAEGGGGLGNLALADAVGQDADLVLRVVTQKRPTPKKGEKKPDRSGLIVLGGRETPIDGVLIHNVPCSDFSEIEPITDRRKVVRMLMKENKDEEAESGEPEEQEKETPTAENALTHQTEGDAKKLRRSIKGAIKVQKSRKSADA